MQKARLYLAITAYVIFIKRFVNKSFAGIFQWLSHKNKLLYRLGKLSTPTANKSSEQSVGKMLVPLHTYTSLGFSKGYQSQICRL
jgi:hypothetical protein